MNRRNLLIKQLDEQLMPLVAWTQGRDGCMPKGGWVRLWRKALGMTLAQLAKRAGMHPSRIVRIEEDEAKQAVTLRTLQSMANAMGGELVYAIVPKQSVRDIVEKQAYKVAQQQIERVAHSMSLENQSTTSDHLREQTISHAEKLLSQSSKHLWNEN
ncbi:MAG: mobile mystery protein A [Pseudomonadota bacterium]